MLRNSLVRRVGAVVAAISIVALINIMISLAVSGSIQGSATAINIAGSLRMQSFQMLAQWHRLRDQTSDPVPAASGAWEAQLQRFTERLHSQPLVSVLPDAADHEIFRQHGAISALWLEELKPLLMGPAVETEPATLHQLVGRLVDQADALVTLLEQRTEARIRLMNLVQIVSLIVTLLVIVALYFDTKIRVVQPLKRLLTIALAVGSKDFSQRSGFRGDDELSRLGRAFDQMTEELGASYRDLEAEASEKTEALERSHAALRLLHSASRSLFASGDLCDGAIPLLQNLEELLGIGPIRLYLHDRNSLEPVQALTTAAKERPYYCRDHDCNACLVSPHALDDAPLENPESRRLMLPIRTSTNLLGTLEVWYPGGTGLPETARRLLETLSDQLATAIFLQRQMTEQQRLTLAEERAIIARELHDSLAQSLSYLKMQVARLRRLDIVPDNTDRHNEILNELSTGLNSAYRQLRELLTTFRLKLDTPDLGTALRETVIEFGERLPNPVQLTYDLPPAMLSANEEIHVLQIVREALANTVKHANASQVEVAVTFRSPKVQVRVTDDGKGLPESGQPPQHYGLIIMHDRARTLGGKIAIENREGGGVNVELGFVPKSRHLITRQASTES
ncbi:histidine kinase [Marinobacter salicampi]|uniref:histidine kinase n=1 Tax=Marinobacter salicampi TaxID=435907 RepID=UPI00140C31FF|nr:histidine kinase [Marinobacter salicampi]